MSAAAYLDAATLVALVLLTLALLIAVVRLVRGPTLPDRVLALDLLTTLAVAYVGVVALRTGFSLYVDIAIAVALAGFVATVALARFVLDAGGEGAGQGDAAGTQVLEENRGKYTHSRGSRAKHKGARP